MAEDWDRDQYGLSAYGGNWMPASPKPFVNTKYQLAGGMDTPGMVDSRVEENLFGEPAFRKSLSDLDEKKYNETLQNRPIDYFGLEREGNGRPRGHTQQQESTGWSKSAFSVVGAVVGKAWEFCKAGATVFTGFRAGGGQAYTNEFDSVAKFETIDNNWESEKNHYDFEIRVSTPLPGRYPGEDFSYIQPEDALPEESPSRPTKRRQVSGGFRDEEIAKNWVVVPNPTAPSLQPRSRPPLRPSNSHVSHPSLAVSSRPPSRASMLPTSRPVSRASLVSTSNPRRSLAPRGSHAGSQALSPSRGASFASPRSPASRIPRATGSPLREVRAPQQESPAAREAKKWKALKRKEEREADESIRRLDAQLKAMIREGKEALGTKIEVLDDDMSNDDYAASRKW